MSGLRRKLDALVHEALQGERGEPEKLARTIREQAEHTNHCFLRDAAIERRGELLDSYGSLEAMTEAGIDWSDEALAEDVVPPFVIEGDGRVFCSRDGRPVTALPQTLAEEWYWRQVRQGNPGTLLHDEEAEAFYTPEGELALSRDRANIQHIFHNL